MPMGQYKDFDECVMMNQDKADPEAYCGEVMNEAEGKSLFAGITKGPERRTMVGTLELREDGDKRFLSGITAPFNKRSEDLGWFVEEIQPGAFKNALTISDPVALFNHNPDNLLARASAGTLKLEEREAGLWYEANLPGSQIAQTVREGVQRKDIQGNSFAFTVAPEGGDLWEMLPDGRWLRRVVSIQELYDVGPVVYPAYRDTSVSLRSLEVLKQRGFLRRDLRERLQAVWESVLAA